MSSENDKRLTFEEFHEEIISFVENVSAPAQGSDEDLPAAKDVFLREICENYLMEILSDEDSSIEYYQDNRIQAASHSDDWDSISLFISDYSGKNTDFPSDYSTEELIKKRFYHAEKILEYAFTGAYQNYLEHADPLYDLARIICEHREIIRDISLYLITDIPAKSSSLETINYPQYTVSYHIRDLRRIYESYLLLAADQSSDMEQVKLSVQDTEINLGDFGVTLPCLPVSFDNPEMEYQSYLAAVPGVLLAKLYEEKGEAILQGNVRVFLQDKREVNKGIKKSLTGGLKGKLRFFAYNNGISATANGVELQESDGQYYIKSIRNFQIVNGGQTTASIHNVWKDHKSNDRILNGVYVQMKLTVVEKPEILRELVPKISEYSNTQNAVSKADLNSSDPFFTHMQNLSRRILCPDGTTKWFYERVSGQYGEDKRLKGTSKAAIKEFETICPSDHRITKTDIGLYYMTWEGMPYSAANGGSKNFGTYTKELKKRGNGVMPTPDERYYKEMMALALMFKRLDALVKRMFKEKGVEGGPKQQVVIYTLALLSHITKQQGSLNLVGIWNSQNDSSIRLPDDLETYLSALCEKVWAYIENWKPSGRIVSEWTKKDECWILLRDTRTEYHLKFPVSLSKYLLSSSEQKKREEWLKSLHAENAEPNDVVIPVSEPELIPQTHMSNSDNNVSDKLNNLKSFITALPEDITSFVTKNNVQFFKLVSDIEKTGLLPADDLNILNGVVDSKKKHRPLPPLVIKGAALILLELKLSTMNFGSAEDRRNYARIQYEDQNIFEYESKGVLGMMIIRDGKYVLIPGSTLIVDEVPSIQKSVHDFRQKLIDNQSLLYSRDGKTAYLKDEATCESSGLAASVVTANSVSGPISWKLNGKTLQEYESMRKK